MTPHASHHRTSPESILAFLGTSVTVHAMVLWFIWMLPPGDPVEPTDLETRGGQAEQIRVRMLDESSLPDSLKLVRKEREKREKKKKEKEPEPKPKPADMLPYVVQDTLVKEQDPDRANYSGRQARKVEKETQNKARPGASIQQQALATRIAKGEADGIKKPTPTREVSETPSPSKTTREELETRASEPDVILPGGPTSESAPDPSEIIAEDPSALPREGMKDGDPTGETEFRSPFPTQMQVSNYAEQLGSGGTYNYLENVDEGDLTLLNQKKNRYWSFWDRLTKQVRREWSPAKEYRKRDPYGNVYGKRNFYTRVAVTLDYEGAVHKLRVIQSSGVDFMDDEAVRALLDAGPYPNPPEGMKDEDGLIHFKFGFLLEVTDGRVNIFNIKPENPF